MTDSYIVVSTDSNIDGTSVDITFGDPVNDVFSSTTVNNVATVKVPNQDARMLFQLGGTISIDGQAESAGNVNTIWFYESGEINLDTPIDDIDPPPPPPGGGDNFISYTVTDVTNNSFIARLYLSTGAPAKVQYRLKGDVTWIDRVPHETSSTFANHVQPVPGSEGTLTNTGLYEVKWLYDPGLTEETDVFEVQLSPTLTTDTITDSGFRALVTLPDFGPARLQYRVQGDTNWIDRTPYETSNTYQSHIQTVPGTEGGTLPNGQSIEYRWLYDPTFTTISETVTVTLDTTAPPPDPGDFPVGEGTLLPHGGLAMGVDTHRANRVGNLHTAMHVGCSIVCLTNESPVTGISFETRMISDLNISSRSKDGIEPYKTLYEDNWPWQYAGWITRFTYSTGNPTMYAEVRLALPNSFLPDMSSSGRVKQGDPSLAKEFWDYPNTRTTYNLPSSFTPVVGQRYCLLLLNVDPPPDHTIQIPNKADAIAYQDAHPQRGLAGFNGSHIADLNNDNYIPANTPHLSPIMGDNGSTSIRSNDVAGQYWGLVGRGLLHMPFFGFRHADGKDRGTPFYDYRRNYYEINGGNRIRYKFTPSYNFPTDRLWIAYGHSRDVAANGSAMTVTVQEGASTIITDTVPADLDMSDNNISPNAQFAAGTEKWSMISFSQDTLNSGTEYTITLSAGNGARFAVYMREPRFTTDVNTDLDYSCQYSTNSGGSWSAVNRSNQSGGYLFMHVNAPDILPIPDP